MKVLLFFSLMFCLGGCGVKGDPLPPLEPVKLKKGKPKTSFKKNKLYSPELLPDEEEWEEELDEH